MASSSSMPMVLKSPHKRRPIDQIRKRASCKARNQQCTHITMTRVYSESLRCSVCLQPGQMGWLYRCTQDTELLLENELETDDDTATFDNLNTMLPPSLSPKKNSAAARTVSNLTFLDELKQEDLQSYSPVQISTILKQRSRLLKIIKKSESNFEDVEGEGLCISTPSENQILPPSTCSTSPETSSSPKKSWLPTQECQFKCCPACRPGYIGRGYLSLDAVAMGELAATAVTGFGFQYQKERPVAPAGLVRNLGLRPNPVPGQKELPTFMIPAVICSPPKLSSLAWSSPTCQAQPVTASASASSPFNDELNADTTFGQMSNAYDSAAMTRSLNAESSSSKPSNGMRLRRVFQNTMLARRQETENTNPSMISPLRIAPIGTKSARKDDSIVGAGSELREPIHDSRSIASLKTHRDLPALHEGSDVLVTLPLNEALLNRSYPTRRPTETAKEQITMSMIAAPTAQGGSLGNHSSRMADPTTPVDDSVTLYSNTISGA